MSPLRWMQSTAPHWTVMLEDVTSDTLTEVGAAEGTEKRGSHFYIKQCVWLSTDKYHINHAVTYQHLELFQ